MTKTLRVSELFNSVQGEGLWTGMPMRFLRLQGCNLRCSFCDTKGSIASQGGEEISVAELSDELLKTYGHETLLITGGEPLLQQAAVRQLSRILRQSGWRVHLETNGAVEMLPAHCLDFDWITVSPKGPKWDCLIPYRHVSEIKFVMGTELEYSNDLEGDIWPDGVVIKHFWDNLSQATSIWLQPKNNDPDAIEWCLALIDELGAATPLRMGLSVQMHKFIGAK